MTPTATVSVVTTALTTATMTPTDKLERGCDELGVAVSAAQAGRLRAHLALVLKWNRRAGLTAVTGADAMVVRHVLDSLSVAPFIAGGDGDGGGDGDHGDGHGDHGDGDGHGDDGIAGGTLLDIGSGGGFPGVPLAVVRPDLRVTLLESRGKRAEFLRHAVGELGVENVTVVNARVQDYRPARKFATLVARAFASLADAVTASVALQHRGVKLLAMKGKSPVNEVAALDESLRARTTTTKLTVPFLAAERHLVTIEF